MNEIQIFNNPDFGEVRTMEENGTVLFCGSDVAKALGYAKPQNAIATHCKGALKRGIPTNSGTQEMLFIPESDLYRLVFSSKLPTAEKFTDWVTSEVLPTIRRHGMYATPDMVEKMLADPDTTIKLLETIKQERAARQALEAQAEADKPKVLFADAVSASHTSILVGDLAKLLRQNGVDIGQNRLFRFLRDNGYLCSHGERYNLPTQRSMDRGWFQVKETTINQPDGSIRVTRTVKVTGKGQQYFINLFLSNKETEKDA